MADIVTHSGFTEMATLWSVLVGRVQSLVVPLVLLAMLRPALGDQWFRFRYTAPHPYRQQRLKNPTLPTLFISIDWLGPAMSMKARLLHSPIPVSRRRRLIAHEDAVHER